MKNFAAAIVVLALAATANAQITDTKLTVDEAGAISVSSNDPGRPSFEIVGVELVSSGGYLAKGTGDNPFTPIELLPNQVAMAKLGGTVLVDGSLTLPYNYTGDVAGVPADMAGSGISGTDGVATSFTVVEGVPEPATGLLAAFGALGLMAFRRRK